MSGLHFDITGDNSNILRKLQETKEGVKNTSKQIEESGVTIEDLFGRLAKGAAAIGAGFTVKELISKIVNVRGEFQQLEVAFKTMLGSETKANTLMTQLVDTAAKTPFDLQGVANGAKQLLAYGLESDKVNGTLIRLGDIASGLSIPLGDLVYLYGTTMTQGRLYTQDLNQFTGRGIPMVKELAKQFNVAESEVKELVTAGKVGFPEVQRAIESMTNKGSKFGGLMEEKSKTIAGQISNIGDAITTAFDSLGKQSEGVINAALSGVSALVENWQKVGQILVGLVATYGTYKVACMAVTAIHSAQVVGLGALTTAEAVHYGWLVMMQKAQAILNATMLTNPYVLLSVALVGVGAAMWAMSDSTSASEKAQKKYNKAKEEAKLRAEEEKDSITKLIDEYNNEITTKTRKIQIDGILKKDFPLFYKCLVDEEGKVRDLTEAWKLYNIEKEKQQITKERKDYTDIQGQIEGRKWALKLARQSGDRVEEAHIQKELEDLYADRAEHEKGLLATNLASYKVQISKFSKDKVNAELKALEEARKTGKRATINGISMAGRRLDSYIGVLKEEQGKKVETSTYQKDYDKAKKEWDDAKKKLSEIEKDKERFTSKQYDEAKKLSESKEKAYKDLGGDIKDYTKEEEAANRKKDAVEKKRLKEEQKNHDDYISLVRSNQQDTIDLMDEGSEKTIKKIELDYQKTTDAIRKQEREWSKNGITNEQSVQISLAYTNAEDKRDKEIQNYYKSLLDKYKGYLEQRETLNEQYDRDKDNLVKAGASQAYIEELELQRTKALEDIDSTFAMRDEKFQQWATSIANWSISELEKEFTKAKKLLAEMEKENPNDPNLASARAKVNELEDEIEKENISTDPDKESFKEWQQLYSTLQKVSGQFKELGKDIGGAAGESISAVGEIATSTISIISSIQSFSQISSKSIEGVSDSAAKSIKAVEKASVILAIIEAALQLMQQINSLLPTAENEYDKYAEKVKEINKLTDAVNQYKIAALEAQQAESKWFSEDNLKNLRDYKELHDAIAKEYVDKAGESQAIYQNKGGGGWFTNFWNTLLDNTYGKIYGVDFGRQYEKGTTAAINNLRIETRKKGNGFLGSGIGGKSQKTEDLQAWINSNKNLFKGLDTDLFDKEGLLNNELAKAIVDNYGDKLVGQTKETLEALIKIREQYDEYLNQLHEYVSSLYEPLADNVVASLWDWLDSGKDALDSFKEYAGDTFRDIVSDMLKTIVINKVIGTFSKDISDMYDKYATGKLTEEELAAEVAKRTQGLVDSYETALPTMENILTNINENFKKAGIDLTNTSSSTQDSTSKGYNTMDQETGNELNGRFTALQVLAENNNQTSLSILSCITQYLGIFTSSNGILDEIKNLTITSNSHLENIAKYTKDLTGCGEKLDKLIKVMEG